MNYELLFIMATVGFSATYLWRFLGVMLADHLDSDMPIVYWIELVGYGLIASILARLTFMPAPPLEATPLWLRIAAVALAIGLARLTNVGNLMAILTSTGLLALGFAYFIPTG